jgi:hypothetical protein
MQRVGELGTRIADVQAEVIRDRHVRDRLIQVLVRVAGREHPAGHGLS